MGIEKNLPARLREKFEFCSYEAKRIAQSERDWDRNYERKDKYTDAECEVFAEGMRKESERLSPILERLIECVEALEDCDRRFQGTHEAASVALTALRDCLGEEC